jgi:hypothetical protein
VIEHGIKPLLGQAFEFRAWVEQLTHGRLPEPERELQRLAALQSHGGDRRSDQARRAREDQDDNIILKQQGTSAAYIRARLQRDHPEVAAALDRGEYPSARAAAIEAGIIKPVPTIRVTNDMPAVAAKLCQHLNREQRIQLIDLLAPDL